MAKTTPKRIKKNVRNRATSSANDVSLNKTNKAKYFCPMPENIIGAKAINLALQGGGAHAAFAWGVMDRLLEDGRIHIEGISGTSAGSMNAVVLAYGLLEGGREGARQKLYEFWNAISEAGQLYNPAQLLPLEKFWYGNNTEQGVLRLAFESLTRWFSPYQLNPCDFNPLRDVLLKTVDFEHLQTCQVTKLFLTATNVRTGQVKVFRTDEVSVDVVMASACLPTLFKAVEIDGEYYWDGGYTGNPALFPLYKTTQSCDILIIHINPIERPAPPMLANQIFNRVNEISFNSSLLNEYRAIAFVNKLLDEDWLKKEYRDKLKYILLHSISADNALSDLSVATKNTNDWDFLLMLRNRGIAKANEWLARHFNNVGVRSTVDLKSELVNLRKKNTLHYPSKDSSKSHD